MGRAEVGDLDNNGVTSVGKSLARAVCLGSQLPAGTATWAGASTGAHSEFVLRDCCVVARLGRYISRVSMRWFPSSRLTDV